MKKHQKVCRLFLSGLKNWFFFLCVNIGAVTTCNVIANQFFFLFFSLGARVFFTIALDLVISGIQEPVRFLIEAKARICVSNSKGDILSQDISDTIWSSFKKLSPFTEEFDMILKEV